MSGKDQEYRIFVGGLSWDITERQLEDAFSRFGKVIDSQVMLERDTHRPRGFGFLTFGDRRAMDNAIRDMNGSELGGRTISVNKAQPRMGGDGMDHAGYGEGYSSGGGRDSYGGGGYVSGGRGGSYGGLDRSSGQDSCFRCGRPGHWARDCPLDGGGGRGGRPMTPPSRSRFSARGDRFGSDNRDRYLDDRYDRGHYAERVDRLDSRDDRYGSRDRYVSDRYAGSGDRFAGSRYGGADRFTPNGYGKERGAAYGRDGGGTRVSGDRYAAAGAGGPTRYEGGRSYRDSRAGPYDRPRRAGQSPSFDRY
ncbi:unnamed protein product [Cuscuta epithymum]|uniref:Uncharacterized protein n=1 Tax=Cuscuta epithymum TaxID=186058 RepID=A0AAV0FQ79_9ASTE|nr:unnamed protein product [Cuscuta epithymum]